MKFRFTIGKKLGTGFGVLILLTLIAFIVTNKTLNTSKEINDEITHVYNPSVAQLEELKLMVVRSKMLIYNWVYTQEQDTPDKRKLNKLTEQEYPYLKKKLLDISQYWPGEDRKEIKIIIEELDGVFEMHEEVKNTLNTFESYEDPNNKFLANFRVEEGGDIYEATEEIMFDLENLINLQKHRAAGVTKDMIKSFSNLQLLVRSLGITLVIGGILIALFTTRSIVKPVQRLKFVLHDLSKGIFPTKSLKARRDEIGEMTEAMNKVVEGLKSTKDFANEVGSGNFETNYHPLSEKDTLGKALLTMRDDLAENERMLEEKVKQRTAEVVQKKEEIEQQSKQINELYNQVTDSIKYAKRIQEAILPPDDYVEKILPNSFILYKPKDIVSGDFYWVEERHGKIYFAAVDCTGHGVPGALMSIVGYNNLNHALVTNEAPAKILDGLNAGVSATLRQKGENATAKDGMDLALCSYDPKTKELEYAGANNPLYILRDNEIEQIKANKFPIGSDIEREEKEFTNHKVKVQEGDHIFIFSDGYADQFGGPKGKKFMYKRFRNLLVEASEHPVGKQRDILNQKIEEWKEGHEQVDDILVMGLKIK